MFGCDGHYLAQGRRRGPLNDESVSGVHADHNAIGRPKVYRRLSVRDAAGHHANLPGPQTKTPARAFKFRPSSSLDKQFGRGMKEGTCSSLKKSHLLWNMDLQPARTQRGKHLFQVQRNHKHEVRFL